MSEPQQPPERGGAPPPTEEEIRSEIDWDAAAGSPEFEELTKRTRAWILPATVFFLVWYLGFILLAGYAPDFMGSRFLADGLTVGYVIALSQFVMVFALALAYRSVSLRTFDDLRVKAASAAVPKGSRAADTLPGGAAAMEDAKADREDER